MKRYFGIDLGTTYSCISMMDSAGSPRVIPNDEGETTTPSVVWYRSDGVVVGREAKERMSDYPDSDGHTHIICDSKRDMGNDQKKWKVYSGQGQGKCKEVTPKDVAVEIISSLLNIKEVKRLLSLGDEYVFVVTCPNDYGMREKQLVKDAAREAFRRNGFDPDAVLDIQNEPIAAAYCYYYGEGINASDNSGVLVFDMGGGTLDITLMKRTVSNGNTKFSVVYTTQRSQLGGRNWDEKVYSEIKKQYSHQRGKSAHSMDDDESMEVVCNRLERRSEEVKKDICRTGSFYEEIDGVDDQGSITVNIDQDELDEITDTLMGEAMSAFDDAYEQAKNANGFKLDRVLFVGGSCKNTAFKNECIRRHSELREIVGVFKPDDAIANGAAFYAKMYSDVEEGFEKGTEPTTAFDTGSMAHSYGTDTKGNMCDNLVCKGERIPLRVERRYYTVTPNQRNLDNKIFQNDYGPGRFAYNRKEFTDFGCFPLRWENGVPQGTPIKVIFKVSPNMVMTCYCECNGEHGEFSFELKE